MKILLGGKLLEINKPECNMTIPKEKNEIYTNKTET